MIKISKNMTQNQFKFSLQPSQVLKWKGNCSNINPSC